ELGRGDALGELALLSGSQRSASVRAARASDLLAVDRSDFDELARSTLSLSLSLNRVLAEQLRNSRAPAARTRPLPATVALVSLDEAAPRAEVARRLAGALDSHLSAVLLDGREASSNGSPGALAPLLDRAEAEHDVVVLDAGELSSGRPWTELCLQQAD